MIYVPAHARKALCNVSFAWPSAELSLLAADCIILSESSIQFHCHAQSSLSNRTLVHKQASLLLLTKYTDRCFCLQTDREGELHTLARALLEHETLTRNDIQQVLDGTFSKVPVAREAAEAEVEALLAGHAHDAAEGSHRR